MAKEISQTHLATSRSISALYAGSVSLNVFWMVLFGKASSGSFKGFLNWYSPIGPLLSFFIIGLVAFGAFYWWSNRHFSEASQKALKVHQRRAALLFVFSAILFLFATFPPIFEPIAEIFHS